MFRKLIPACVMVCILLLIATVALKANAANSRLGTQFFEEDNNHLLQYTLSSVDLLKARIYLDDLVYVDKNTRLTVAAESIQIGLATKDIPNWVKGNYENIRYADLQFKNLNIYNTTDSLTAEKLQMTFQGYVKDLQDAMAHQTAPKEPQSFHLVLASGNLTVPESYRQWYFDPAAISFSEMTLDGLYQGSLLTVNARLLSPAFNGLLTLAVKPNLKDYQQSTINQGSLTLTNIGNRDADNLISNMEVRLGRIFPRENDSITLLCAGTIGDPVIVDKVK